MNRAVLPMLASAIVLLGCDPARFRPAKGVKEEPSVPTAYRVPADKEGCKDLGFVIEAASIDAVAATAANHGGTHYRILDDFGRPKIGRAHV